MVGDEAGRRGSIISRTLDSVVWTRLHAKRLKGKKFAVTITLFEEFNSRSTGFKK